MEPQPSRVPSSQPAAEAALRAPWSAAPDAVLHALAVTLRDGLDSAEAARRRAVHGPNQLHQKRRRTVLRVLLDQLRSLLVALLAIAAGLAFALGEAIEGAAIAVVVLLNVAIGFATELRAVRSLEASKLEADQSALTGESVPVRKEVAPVAADTPVAERSCMLFKGTALSRGGGRRPSRLRRDACMRIRRTTRPDEPASSPRPGGNTA